MGSSNQWADEELTGFYQHYHNTTKEWDKLAELLPDRTAAECENLYAQYQTFLSLSYSSGLQAAFVAMVKDVYKNKLEEDTGKQPGEASAAAAAAGGEGTAAAPAEAREGSPAHPGTAPQPSRLVQASAAPMQPLGSGIHSPSKQQLQSPGRFASPRPKPHGALAVLVGTSSQNTSGPDGDQSLGGSDEGEGEEEEDDEGDGEDEGTDGQRSKQGGQGRRRRKGGNAGSSTPSRPQRVRKPKQYLGEEPHTTPTRPRNRGSLPTTPASASRRPARGAVITPTRTSRRVAAQPSPMQDSGSAKKRRHRRLFEELQQQGLAGDAYAYEGGYYSQGYGQQWSDEEGAAAAAGEGGGYIDDDDVGEGVDALLSLASLAHASSSAQTDSQALQGDDAGPSYRSRSAGRSRPGRSGSLKAGRASAGRAAAAAAAAAGEDGDAQGDDYWGAFEAAAAAVEAADRAKSQMTGEGSSDDMDADEAAAGGLAQMRGSQANFFSTPQKRAGSGALQELFYRTGTPGGRAEYLLASPGSQDRPPLGLPSPSGSRGRGGRGGAARASNPLSPASRKGFKPRRGKSARGAAGRAAAAAARAAAAAAAAAAGSQGSSGQRGGTVGRAAAAAAAAEGMDLDAHGDGLGHGMAGLLVSESELLSENEHDYMEGGLHMPESGLAASCLSSPHLRTNSVHDPPRSVMLLGKRGFDEEAGEPTPASKLRSVRQKTTEGTTDLPFLLPQPLFTAGGSSGRHGSYDGGPHSVERGDGRGGRGGKGGKKKAKEAPNRNRRKPQHSSVKQNQGPVVYEPPGARSESMLRHMMSGGLRRWVLYEWLYPAIDRPWFMRNELQELLDASGLGHVTHLTRPEWSVLRGTLGRPRRLSLAFLKQERQQLEAYRERIRGIYELGGVGGDVPTDMPRALRVGQSVVARHPATRMAADGIVLTIKPSKYRVQFNRSELLTEVVRDTDVMPTDPGDNLPLAQLHVPLLLNGRPTAPTTAAAAAAASLARRRQQQQAAAQAAAAQQQQAQLLAAAAAAQAAAVRQEEYKTDMSDITESLDRLEKLLAQLQAMHIAAEEAGGKLPEALQPEYNTTFASIQTTRTELQGVVARLHSRQHPGIPQQLLAAATAALHSSAALIAAAASGKGSAQQGAGQVQSATAAAAAAAAAAMPRLGSLQGMLHSPAGSSLAATPAGGAGLPGGAGALLGAAGTDAAGAAAPAGLSSDGAAAVLVAAASDEARSAVQRIQTRHPQLLLRPATAAADASEPGDGSDVAAEEGGIEGVVLGCISLLVAVHKLTDPSEAAAAAVATGAAGMTVAQQLGPLGVESALDAVLQQLKPRSAVNLQAYADIVSTVGQLKAQLARAC